MQGKVALEEHFAVPETLQDSSGFLSEACWQELSARLLDIQERRLREMDAHGIEMMLLSLNAPAVQRVPNVAKAVEMARRANDYLAAEVAKRPQRFQGFAALPMQDPEQAARELTRCVKDLGFKGALVNGFSQVGDGDEMLYYDLPMFRGFWAEAERLGVPFYLHPRNPLPQHSKIYEGHAWLLGPTWAFGQETAVHALRLMGSGAVRRTSRSYNRYRPHGGGAADFDVAGRQPQRLDQSAEGSCGETASGDVFSKEFLRDDIR